MTLLKLKFVHTFVYTAMGINVNLIMYSIGLVVNVKTKQ